MYKAGQILARRDKVASHSFRGARYGLTWHEPELELLRSLYNEGVSVLDICSKMERPAAGILSKLTTIGFVRHSADGNYYCVVDSDQVSSSAPVQDDGNIKQIQGEVEMANNIETVVMIRGVNAADKTDDEIFELIRMLESSTEGLERIVNKPNKLRTKIEQIKADIIALVSYVDSREVEPIVPGVKPVKF